MRFFFFYPKNVLQRSCTYSIFIFSGRAVPLKFCYKTKTAMKLQYSNKVALPHAARGTSTSLFVHEYCFPARNLNEYVIVTSIPKSRHVDTVPGGSTSNFQFVPLVALKKKGCAFGLQLGNIQNPGCMLGCVLYDLN